MDNSRTFAIILSFHINCSNTAATDRHNNWNAAFAAFVLPAPKVIFLQVLSIFVTGLFCIKLPGKPENEAPQGF